MRVAGIPKLTDPLRQSLAANFEGQRTLINSKLYRRLRLECPGIDLLRTRQEFQIGGIEARDSAWLGCVARKARCRPASMPKKTLMKCGRNGTMA
jgi:hypothetical protein